MLGMGRHALTRVVNTIFTLDEAQGARMYD